MSYINEPLEQPGLILVVEGVLGSGRATALSSAAVAVSGLLWMSGVFLCIYYLSGMRTYLLFFNFLHRLGRRLKKSSLLKFINHVFSPFSIAFLYQANAAGHKVFFHSTQAIVEDSSSPGQQKLF